MKPKPYAHVSAALIAATNDETNHLQNGGFLLSPSEVLLLDGWLSVLRSRALVDGSAADAAYAFLIWKRAFERELFDPPLSRLAAMSVPEMES